jgi:hypothetical protein
MRQPRTMAVLNNHWEPRLCLRSRGDLDLVGTLWMVVICDTRGAMPKAC